MRGQKLFVRPMEGGDADAVRLFLQSETLPAAMPESALIGKLVGNLVAVLTMSVSERSVEIRDLIVAHDLRKKRIGRFMIDELDRLAGKMEREWLVADRKRGRGFLERVGFHDDGEWMVRRVRR